MGERRESKKRETRQRISDVATAMFFARGFDAVTLDEIAAAANVSKMTVLNYFARKVELMLDREDDLLLLPFREALRARPSGQAPIDALRGLVDGLNQQHHPFAHVERQMVGWWRVVTASPALRARVRELADEATEGLALELAGPRPDGLARLMAGMIVLTVRMAREEALLVFERGGSAKKANAAFLALIDRGFTAVHELEASKGPGPAAPGPRVEPKARLRGPDGSDRATRPPRFSAEDLHQALFPAGAPPARTLGELEDGIREHLSRRPACD
jgi:AcrR family transcriptional regulator